MNQPLITQLKYFRVANLYLIICCVLLSAPLFSQQDNIEFSPANDGTTVLTCNGFITDSGGQGGPGYGNNENFTITVCPDTITSGDNSEFITITFNFFQLDGTNTGTQQNPNIDVMTVYDGPDATSPTLGTYNTDELENVSISGTNQNPSGCLTFSFYSNSTGTGSFTASATCSQPCVPPLADAFIVGGDTPDSIRVCVGEEVTFDGSASTPGNGFNIEEYSWNFQDGTIDNTSGPVVSHSFNAPGQYQVQLTLTDDNEGVECTNLNVVPLKVYVSNYPTYSNFPSDTLICVGQLVDLAGIVNFGQYDSTWTGFPSSNAVDDGCLPDTLLGISQSIPVTYSEFDPSDVITSADDIEDICLNMEHSFMGDLVIQLTCPNGTTINLQEQGGGGTQIGVPDQADNVNCEDGSGIGEGWTYCWTADANETWTEWVDNNGGGQTLPEGDYAPVDSFDDLVGCPLQGTWQITVIDNWAADDGTIFEFGVVFDPSFYPEIVQFTNTVGEGPDSSFWDLSDPFIVANDPDLNEITVQPDAPGSYSYNYEVVNNFGCGFDSTVVVQVEEGPPITAGPDQFGCEEEVTLQGGLEGVDAQCNQDGGNFTYCYGDSENIVQTFCPDNPGDGVTFMEIFINSGGTEDFFDEFTVYDGDNTSAPILAGPLTGDLTGQSFLATNASGCITFEITPDGIISCESGDVEELDITVSCGGGSNLIWSWEPAVGLSDPTSPTPSLTVEETTLYTLTAFPANLPGCAVSDDVLVVSTCCETNAFAGSDAVACGLTYQLDAEPTIGTGTWSGPPEVSFSDVNDPQATVTCESPGGTITLTWTDVNTTPDGSCEESDEIEIIFAESLNINVLAEDAICYDECSGSAVAVISGGTSSSGQYSLEWSSGKPGGVSLLRDSLCAGSHSLIVTDNVGCTDSTTFDLSQPEPQEISVISSPPLCADSCNAEVVITSPGAIEYSFNAGTTFVQDSIGYVCPGDTTVIARDENGCEIAEDISVANTEPFVANFNINPNPTTVENTLVSFQDISRPGPIANSLFLYGDPPIGEGTERISQFRFPEDTSGTYFITLISESTGGCVDTLVKELVINDDLLWFIPNSFSPNGDGINDIWKPEGNTLNINEFNCQIYDRWGKLVFETDDVQQGWNGAVNGSEFYPGTTVFTYFIEITSATTEEKYELTGFITMIR